MRFGDNLQETKGKALEQIEREILIPAEAKDKMVQKILANTLTLRGPKD